MQDREPLDTEEIQLTFPRRGNLERNITLTVPDEGSISGLAARAEREKDYKLTFPRLVDPNEKENMKVVDYSENTSPKGE